MPEQFKKAVTAEASSSPSSRSSSPSSSTSLSVAQQNTIQALHQEHLARLSSVVLPKLASQHSQRFLQLARTQVHATDTMWETQKLQPLQYRRTLWAEDVDPVAGVEKRGRGGDGRIVPDFYHRHNPRCSRCALPLVPGLNQLSAKAKARSKANTAKGAAANTDQHRKSRKRVPTCTLCHHKDRKF